MVFDIYASNCYELDVKKTSQGSTKSEQKQVLPEVEGRDFYFENGLMVISEDFLRRRGYCCESNCRHCPYGFQENIEND